MSNPWLGDFGRSYTIRQPQADTLPTLQTLLRPYLSEIDTALEVGCNRGDNLDALERMGVVATGVEPGPFARQAAKHDGFYVLDALAEDLPFADESFDLVLTAGVLIHIQPDRLDASIQEIRRVARKFILHIEYPADTPTAVTYRGIPDGIWKRPYQASHPCLIGEGDETTLRGTPFDGSGWWLFRK